MSDEGRCPRCNKPWDDHDGIVDNNPRCPDDGDKVEKVDAPWRTPPARAT